MLWQRASAAELYTDFCRGKNRYCVVFQETHLFSKALLSTKTIEVCGCTRLGPYLMIEQEEQHSAFGEVVLNERWDWLERDPASDCDPFQYTSYLFLKGWAVMDCGLVVPHDEVAVLPNMLVLARDCRYVLMKTFNE